MKQIYMLLVALLIVGSASAFTTNDNGGNDPKVELTNSVKSEIAPSITINFELNRDLVKLFTRPACGSETTGPNEAPTGPGWTRQGVECTGPYCYDVYTRECTETVTIYWPWGAQTITYDRTERKTVNFLD